MLDSVFEIVTPVVDELSTDQSDDMDVDEASETKLTADLRERTLASAVDAAQNCLRGDILVTKDGVEKLHAFVTLAAKANTSPHSRTIAASTFDSIKTLAPKLSRDVLDLLGEKEAETRTQILKLLSLEHFPSAPEAFRLKRAQAAAAVAAAPWAEELKRQILKDLREESEAEKSPLVKQVLWNAK